MKRRLVVSLGCAVAALLMCALPAWATPSDSESLAAQVAEIDRSFEPHTSTVGEITRVLNLSPEFERLASSDENLVDQSLAYLSELDHTPLQRRIAILATHKVSVSEWVRFASGILDLYDNHQVDIWEVEDTIFPRPFYSKYAEDYFWRPDVWRVLWRTYWIKELPSPTRSLALFDLIGLQKLLNWLFGSGPY